MFLKNEAKRLITINTKGTVKKDEKGKVVSSIPGKSYDLLPAGPTVEVPNDACEAKFVKALLQVGDISEQEGLDADGSEAEVKDLADMTKGELIDFADANGIETNASDKKADILAAIEAATES